MVALPIFHPVIHAICVVKLLIVSLLSFDSSIVSPLVVYLARSRTFFPRVANEITNKNTSLDYPLMEEYDFRNDKVNPDVPMDTAAIDAVVDAGGCLSQRKTPVPSASFGTPPRPPPPHLASTGSL